MVIFIVKIVSKVYVIVFIKYKSVLIFLIFKYFVGLKLVLDSLWWVFCEKMFLLGIYGVKIVCIWWFLCFWKIYFLFKFIN